MGSGSGLGRIGASLRYPKAGVGGIGRVADLLSRKQIELRLGFAWQNEGERGVAFAGISAPGAVIEAVGSIVEPEREIESGCVADPEEVRHQQPGRAAIHPGDE